MGTITGLTAERMLAIEAASVVDGDIVGDELFLTKHDGSVLNAGNVRGPQGVEGPRGANLSALGAVQVSDVGIINQIRAGRQLTPADFTNMGLSVPIGLWNLSNLTDASGNGRTLTNKAVPQPVAFTSGINGIGSTAAQFRGADATAANTPVLYIPDAGGADPFRIKTGTIGCWFRSARRGSQQVLMSKLSSAAGQYSWELYIWTNSAFSVGASLTGSAFLSFNGGTDICDDRWHFGVATYDGSFARIYVDGNFDGGGVVNGALFGSSAPMTIGGRAGTDPSPSLPMNGRIDEAFITSDVLSEEQIRNLYCASIPHTLGSVPSSFAVSVRRRRRGGALAVTDFPAQPLRLYNFTNGVLTDQGSNNVLLGLTGVNVIVPVAGADGSKDGGYAFSGSHNGLAATDAGLPDLLKPRSYGHWFKAISAAAVQSMFSWGSGATSAAGVWIGLATTTNRVLYEQNAASGQDLQGPDVVDGQWHFVCCTEDNAAIDGAKRKMYYDGRLVAVTTVMASIALGGANRFRLGASADGTSPFTGQLDSAFVCDYVLTYEQIRKLYDIGSKVLAPTPRPPADFIEASEAGRLLTVFDTIESSDSVDLAVMA